MTERLYQHDSTLRSFSATVVSLSADGVLLDKTAFFPAGGGVQGDRGTLRGPTGAVYTVTETIESAAGVLHRLAATADPGGLAVGDAVHGDLDWERRYTLMRYHTGTHVLSGVMFADYGVRVSGNQLATDKGRVDFTFTEFDRSILEEGFARCNAILAQDLPVRVSFVPAEQASARPELFKLEAGFRHELTEVRLVEIVGFDIQADGGCHVSRLSEVGRLVLTKTENKGKSNRRVYFVLDPPGQAS
jgi:misacylated tRNA(Ala) deacylase